MFEGKRNYTGLMLIVISVIVSLGIGTSLYYFKTQRNEQIQNQLHYAELGKISNDLNNAFSQIDRVADIHIKVINQHNALRHKPDCVVQEESSKNRFTEKPGSLSKTDSHVICLQSVVENQKKSLEHLATKSDTLQNMVVEITSPENGETKSEAIGCRNMKSGPEFLIQEAKNSPLALNNQHIFKASLPCANLFIPLNDFISVPLNHFSLIALVNGEGRVLVLKRNNTSDAYQYNLSLENIHHLLTEESDAKTSENGSDENRELGRYSTFVHKDLGGKDFRVYVSPYSIPVSINGNSNITEELSLVGFRPTNELSFAKLHLSPDIAKSLIFGLAMFAMVLPFIKLRFVSHKYCFKSSDTWAITIGLILLTGFATIYVMQSLYETEVRSKLSDSAESIHSAIVNQFKREVKEVSEFVHYVHHYIDDEHSHSASNVPAEKGGPQPYNKSFADLASLKDLVTNNQLHRYLHIESIFKLEKDGTFSDTALRTSETLHRRARPNLSHREYFRKIKDGEGWKYGFNDVSDAVFGDNNTAITRFYVQRIFNKADGRKSTQISWPAPQTKNTEEHGKDFKVLTATLNLQSLLQPLMPRNMKFVVFEPDSGQVLYASDDHLSLVENFYIASENPAPFRHYIQKISVPVENNDEFWRKGSGSTYPDSFRFAGYYHGENTEFFVAPIDTHIPWLLAIIHDETELEQISLLSSVSSMLLMTVLILIGCLFIMATFGQLPWHNLLIYRKTKTPIYGLFAVTVFLLVAVQLIFVLKSATLFQPILFGLLTLVVIKRMASTYLLPNRRVKNLTYWMIAALYSILIASILHPLEVSYRFMVMVGISFTPVLLMVWLHRLGWQRHFAVNSKNRPWKRFNCLWLLWVVLFALALLAGITLTNSTVRGAFAQDPLRIALLLTPLVVMLGFGLVNKKALVKHPSRTIKLNLTGYAFYLMSLVVAIGLVPGAIFQTANFAYLLNEWHAAESKDRDFRLRMRRAEVTNYFDTVGHQVEGEGPDKIAKTFHYEIESDGSLLLKQCGDQVPTQEKTSSSSQHSGFLEQLFYSAALPMDFTTQMYVTRTLRNQARSSLTDKGCFTSSGASVASHLSVTHILQAGFSNYAVSFTLYIVILFSGLFYICRQMICKRLYGIELSDDFRLGIYERSGSTDIARLEESLTSDNTDTQYALILRPVRKHIDTLLETFRARQVFGEVIDLHAVLMTDTQLLSFNDEDSDSASLISQSSTESKEQQYNINLLKLKLALKNRATEKDILILKNLGAIAFDAKFRRLALQFLEHAMTNDKVNIIILADVSPLFKLTRQYAYPSVSPTHFATPNERMLWSNLFARFNKFYDWNPAQEVPVRIRPDAHMILMRETSCWPELESVRNEFYAFHHRQRMNSQQRAAVQRELTSKNSEYAFVQAHLTDSQQFVPGNNREKVENYGFDTVAFKQSIDECWTEKQVLEFISEHAGAIFRYRWEQCTKNERMLLHNLATGHIANPLGFGPLTHLIRRGYIVKDSLWRVSSKSFSAFIISAESATVFKQWMEESEESLWKYVRIPLVISMLVLIGGVIYSATEAVESIIGLLTALLSIIPILLKNMTVVKGDATQNFSIPSDT